MKDLAALGGLTIGNVRPQQLLDYSNARIRLEVRSHGTNAAPKIFQVDELESKLRRNWLRRSDHFTTSNGNFTSASRNALMKLLRAELRQSGERIPVTLETPLQTICGILVDKAGNVIEKGRSLGRIVDANEALKFVRRLQKR